MTRLVIDASVILASLVAEGPTRGPLLGYHDLEFYTPEVVTSEITKHLPMVVQRTGKPREIVESLLNDVLRNVEVVPASAFAMALPSARKRTTVAHAQGDEVYVALADVLSAPVWTYDKDFRRITGVRVLSTGEVQRLIESG